MFVGNILVDTAEAAKKPERASAVATFVERTAILRESGVACLNEFLTATLGASGHDLLPQAVETSTPGALTVADATTIGRGFDAIIRVSATPSDAVDELLQTYPAASIAAQQHIWLPPMLETIAKRRAETATLGLKLRLTLGAALSIGDMASDAVQIVAMFLAGQSLRALALLAMIAMNLAVQAIAVVLQSAHRGWQAVWWELSIVFSLLKPAIDAIRVAGGDNRVDGAPFDPLVEMVICKCSEMTFESIPGGLAQAIFLLDGGDWTTLAVVSVCLSCISTAFTVTTMAFDLDTNKGKRSLSPEFYGYVPDTSAGHFRVFMLLLVYHSAHALGNTFSMAVLAQTNLVWLVAYLLADHCGLILYKLARGDLVYYVPGFGVLLSMLTRFMVKVITDFTGYARSQPALSLRPHTARSLSQRAHNTSFTAWQMCSFSPPGGVGWHLLLCQRAEERRLVVRRRCSLLTVLPRRDDRAWSCCRHERFCGELLSLPQLHGRKLHRSQRHRCRRRIRAGVSRHLKPCTRNRHRCRRAREQDRRPAALCNSRGVVFHVADRSDGLVDHDQARVFAHVRVAANRLCCLAKHLPRQPGQRRQAYQHLLQE